MAKKRNTSRKRNVPRKYSRKRYSKKRYSKKRYSKKRYQRGGDALKLDYASNEVRFSPDTGDLRAKVLSGWWQFKLFPGQFTVERSKKTDPQHKNRIGLHDHVPHEIRIDQEIRPASLSPEKHFKNKISIEFNGDQAALEEERMLGQLNTFNLSAGATGEAGAAGAAEAAGQAMQGVHEPTVEERDAHAAQVARNAMKVAERDELRGQVARLKAQVAASSGAGK
tara:strand:+ start:310 stop:981 length:672 start_codon:yes stop_codon:yes gene_type:complete